MHILIISNYTAIEDKPFTPRPLVSSAGKPVSSQCLCLPFHLCNPLILCAPVRRVISSPKLAANLSVNQKDTPVPII